MNKKHELMGQEKITKLLFQFSFPAMIGMIVNALYNIVDRIYIGNIKGIGALSIAGVGVVFPIMIFSFAFSIMIGLGGATNISLSLGRKNKPLAELYLGNGICLGTLVGCLISFLTIFYMKSYIMQLGASASTVQYSIDYLRIVALGFPFATVGYIANAAIRSDGNPKFSMITLLIGALINIILDPIFIFYLDMGVKGAALATIISQFVSAVWTILYFRSKNSGLKLHFHNLKLQFDKIKNIILIGTGPFILQLGSSVVTLVANNLLKFYGGDIAVGAMTIINGIVTFVMMPIFGINQGLQPIAGYNYGAKLYKRVKEALLKAILGATIISTTGFLCIQFLSKYFIYIFTTNELLVATAATGLKIFTLMLPFLGFQIVSSIYFQAIGKPKLTMFLSLCRQVLFLIPFLLVFSRIWGVSGIWAAVPCADLLSVIITFILVRRDIKILDKEESNP
ncbi:MATE family efflux transporter [Cetobacterium sp. 2A]|uniref:MATE family efflux transporter n=1 Tax=unclassified Cetobacterium TaxID=2630983 RepID=UPI00163C61A5|nr:MATE family efflux transporter [Cetobacterium sp. 2A]MBC2855502.1 MATE family efflux transporter [Cetobacterium sp. 2A]